MSDQFNDRLRNRIQDVFENYQEEPNLAQWQQLKSQLKKKKRKKAVIWLTPGMRAAAALIPIGLVFWYLSGNMNPSPTSLEEIIAVDSSQNVPDKTNQIPMPAEQNDKSVAESSSSSPENFSPSEKNPSEIAKDAIIPEIEKAPENFSIVQLEAPLKNSEPIDSENFDSETGNTIDAEYAPAKPSLQSLIPLDLLKNKEDYLVQINLEDIQINPLGQPDSGLLSIDDLPQQESRKSRRDRQKVAWGVVLAPAYSFAQDNSSALNLGGGISSEIPLSKNLALASGLRIARQRLDFENNDNNMSAVNPAFFNDRNGTSRDLEGTNLDLVSLDVPINLRYKINWQDDKQVNLSMGVSSLAYLKESYTSTFTETRLVQIFDAENTNISTLSTEVAQVQEQNNNGAFQTLEWAGLLNFSVGIRYPVFSKMSMEIEPYLKYPLRRFTQQDIRLGTGGINLRFILNR